MPEGSRNHGHRSLLQIRPAYRDHGGPAVCKGDGVVATDGDLQHDPTDLPQRYELLSQDQANAYVRRPGRTRSLLALALMVAFRWCLLFSSISDWRFEPTAIPVSGGSRFPTMSARSG